jgi:hypothetical protein
MGRVRVYLDKKGIVGYNRGIMKDRRLRRHHTERYRAKQRRLWEAYFHPNHNNYELTDKDLGHFRERSWKDHGPCQCCCNPRHSTWYSDEEKKTIQERRGEDRYCDQIHDCFYY